MPDCQRTIVINTTPLIALTAATGDLDVLRFLYDHVLVPDEVVQEIRVGGKDAFALGVFDHATWLDLIPAPTVLSENRIDARRMGSDVLFDLKQSFPFSLFCASSLSGYRFSRPDPDVPAMSQGSQDR